MTFVYDPGQGMLVTALARQNTVIPRVVAHGEFWTFLMLHLFFKLMYCAGLMADADVEGEPLHLSWKDVHVITVITTFFAVFYSNESYAHYLHLYDATRVSLETVYDFGFLCKLTFQHSDVQNMRLAFRYFCASVFIGLHQAKLMLADNPNDDMSQLLQNGFLTRSELTALEDVPMAVRSMRLQLWATEVIARAISQHDLVPTPKDDTRIDYKKKPEARPLPLGDASLFYKLMLASRQMRDEVLDCLAMPVPFQYFHTLSVMILVNIALWCYTMALNTSLITIFVFILVQLLFMGMLELGIELSCPFGDDDVDFPLDDWIQEAFRRATAYMENQSPGSIDDWEEALAAQDPLRFGPVTQPPAPLTPHGRAPEGSPLADRGPGPDEQPHPPVDTKNIPGTFSPAFGYMPSAVEDGTGAAPHENGSSTARRREESDFLRKEKRKWRRYHRDMAKQQPVSKETP